MEVADQEVCTRAVVIQDHRPVDESQLDLRVGDHVYVLEKDDSGWWGGHKEGDDTTGWFPYNVVRVYDQFTPLHQEAVPQQSTTTSTSAAASRPADTTSFQSFAHARRPDVYQEPVPAYTKEPSSKSNLSLNVQESHHQPEMQSRLENIASPTRNSATKARWPHEGAKHPDPNSSTSREVMQLKEELKNERSKHIEELTVERGRRESLEANQSKTSARIGQLQSEQDAQRRQIMMLEKENKELRTRLHQAESLQSQHTVGNEAEQLRRLQEQVSLLSRQEEKIWHAVEKNVSPAVLMKIKADAPPELVPQANLGGPSVEVARRLFNGGAETSPTSWSRTDVAHVSDWGSKPPTVPRSAPNMQQIRPPTSSRECTPAKLTRPFSCTDLEPDEAPTKGAVANIVRKLERCGSTPPRRIQEQQTASGPQLSARGRSPACSPKAPAWGPPLQLDSCDNDEPVNFGMSPISTARAQSKIAEESNGTSKGHDGAMVRSATPNLGSSSASSLVRNRVRQLESGY